jgi:hypothetical protein
MRKADDHIGAAGFNLDLALMLSQQITGFF